MVVWLFFWHQKIVLTVLKERLTFFGGLFAAFCHCRCALIFCSHSPHTNAFRSFSQVLPLVIPVSLYFAVVPVFHFNGKSCSFVSFFRDVPLVLLEQLGYVFVLQSYWITAADQGHFIVKMGISVTCVSFTCSSFLHSPNSDFKSVSYFLIVLSVLRCPNEGTMS